MKGKRVLSLALSALLALSLWTVPAAAAGFSDMEGHWAREDVEHLAAQGVVRGTSATTFAPDQKMTACEALLFCSRATGVSAADKAAIAADWADELAEILPEELYSWAAEEMAVCLETGILSETELRALSAADGLVKAISRETLAMYLVRAMQLDEMAQSLTSYSMSFDDTASISAALQPYVYLLATYGIVKGNEANCFLPQGSLTRAEMATMLRRAIDFMEARDIYAELPAYTDYGWVGGTIAQAEEGTDGAVRLTLTSTVSGTQTMTLPADVAIYENNMRATASPLALLQAGTYARVNLDGDGQAVSVRLGGGGHRLHRRRHRGHARERHPGRERGVQAAEDRPIHRHPGRRYVHLCQPAGPPGGLHHRRRPGGRHGPPGRHSAHQQRPHGGGHPPLGGGPL